MMCLHTVGDDYDICKVDGGGYKVFRGIGFVGYYATLEQVLQKLTISKYVYGNAISSQTLKRIGNMIKEEQEQNDTRTI